MNGSLVVGEEPYVDRGSRALVDPLQPVVLWKAASRGLHQTGQEQTFKVKIADAAVLGYASLLGTSISLR